MKTYSRTIKSLFILGISLFVLCLAATIVVPIYNQEIHEGHYFSPTFIDVIDQWDLAPALIVLMFVGSILLTFKAFASTTDRAKSDFYDSLPEKKVKGYFLRLLAVLTYQIAIIILCMLALCMVVSAKGIPVTNGFLLLSTMAFLASSVLVVAATSLAMALTGTRLSNIVLLIIILFLPRALLTSVPYIIELIEEFFVLPINLGMLFNYEYNIVATTVINFFYRSRFFHNTSFMLNINSIIYTFSLGLVYIGASVFLFKRRKSELSGKACIKKTSGYIQAALLVSPVLMFTIIDTLNNTNFSTSIKTWTENLYLIAIIAILFVLYIVFSLVYTRKMIAILKSIPIYLLSALLCFLLVIGANQIAHNILYKTIQVDKIEYVKLDSKFYNHYLGGPAYDYADTLNKEIKFTDDVLINELKNSLDSNIAELMSHTLVTTMNLGYQNDVFCQFKLKDGTTFSRIIHIPEKEFETVQNILLTNEEYINNFSAIPDYAAVRSTHLSRWRTVSYSDEQLSEIWGCYIEEIEELKSELPLDDIRSLTGNNYCPLLDPVYPIRILHKDYPFSGIYSLGFNDNIPYIGFRWFTAATPKTTNMMMAMHNETAMNTHNNWEDIISNLLNYNSAEISFTLYDADSDLIQDENMSGRISKSHIYKILDKNKIDDFQLTKDEVGIILDIIKNNDYKDIDCTEDFITIWYQYRAINDEVDSYFPLYIPLTSDQSIQIHDILEKAGEK